MGLDSPGKFATTEKVPDIHVLDIIIIYLPNEQPAGGPFQPEPQLHVAIHAFFRLAGHFFA